MLAFARNRNANAFQKIMGIWFFASAAAYGMYRVSCKIGVTPSYSSILDNLKVLAFGAATSVMELAKTNNFIVYYDNLNRTQRFYSPDAAQRSKQLSGTASTVVKIEDGDLSTVTPSMIQQARSEGKRRALSLQYLEDRCNDQSANVKSLMVLHCIGFLIGSSPGLKKWAARLKSELASLAVERLPKDRKSTVFPLATTDLDEGSTAGNRDVLDNLFLDQLGKSREDIAEALFVVGGDLATIEKLRVLQRLLGDCPHGYSAYHWLLPLVQLWHMGWADLARIIGTHWGSNNREGSSIEAVNTVLGRNVRKILRPDYYPAQRLVFDNLRAEVLDCFRYVQYSL